MYGRAVIDAQRLLKSEHETSFHGSTCKYEPGIRDSFSLVRAYRAQSRQPDHEWFTADSRAVYSRVLSRDARPNTAKVSLLRFSGSLARIQNALTNLRIAKKRACEPIIHKILLLSSLYIFFLKHEISHERLQAHTRFLERKRIYAALHGARDTIALYRSLA